MENATIISDFDMQLLCHAAAVLDLLLEPYFIYLVLRCSPPAMSVYRWFLLAISITNMVMTLDYAVAWSPIVSIRGFDLCLPSSHFDSRFIPILMTVLLVTLFGQWQVLLASLAYAVAVACWPLRIHIYHTKKVLFYFLIFACLPGATLAPMAYALFTTDVCWGFPFQPPTFVLLGTFAFYVTSYVVASIYLLLKLGQAINSPTSSTSVETVKLLKTLPTFVLLGTFAFYATSYVVASIYLLLKLGQAINNPTSSTSVETVKLAKTVRRNFIFLVAVIFATDVVPALVITATFMIMRGDQMQSVLTLLTRYVSISFCSYSWIITVITIFVTKPYRKRTIQVFRSVSFSK
uniref:G_PROTEIN_RECEP_F1_2 domain-containing protein n=1 Tax=Steinernema glaseri TaxID=37863 RepID=A0A1I7ZK27_9BILA